MRKSYRACACVFLGTRETSRSHQGVSKESARSQQRVSKETARQQQRGSKETAKRPQGDSKETARRQQGQFVNLTVTYIVTHYSLLITHY